MKARFMFRVWDKSNKEWAQDFTLSQDGNLLCDNGTTLFVPSEFVGMQCTGMKDKDGRYIYEGDYVEEEYPKFYDINKYETLSRIGHVYRAEVGFCIDWNEGYINFYKGFEGTLKVIGNIYENPEINLGLA